MVYSIEKFLKIVASLSRLQSPSPPPTPPPKKAENSIFLLCALKKTSEM